jgi:glycosyltransferase involved in cell wall biosynthesis
MRIAVLHGSNDLYGASRVLLTDVEILMRQGHEVSVVLPAAGTLSASLLALGAEVSVEGLHVLRAVAGASAVRLPARLPQGALHADIVIAWTLATAPYLAVARSQRKRAICSVHEILRGRAGTALAWLACRAASGMMVNSRATCSWLMRSGKPSATPVVAYPVAPAYAPLHRDTTSADLCFLLAGRVNGHKGHLEAVKAMEAARQIGLQPARLILLGGAFPGQDHHLDALLQRIAGKRWVEYRGEVADISPHLSEADAMLIPTTRPEPFGVVALEAWAAGRRVIASDEGGLAEAARLVDGVLVKPRDLDELAHTIMRVAGSTSLLAPPSPSAAVSWTCTAEAREAAWRRLI